MTIRFANGEILEAARLSRTGNTMRLAVKSREDVLTLTRVAGFWVSDEGELVNVGCSRTHQRARRAEVKESECICSRDLAARLIDLLYGEDLRAYPFSTSRTSN